MLAELSEHVVLTGIAEFEKTRNFFLKTLQRFAITGIIRCSLSLKAGCTPLGGYLLCNICVE